MKNDKSYVSESSRLSPAQNLEVIYSDAILSQKIVFNPSSVYSLTVDQVNDLQMYWMTLLA